LAEVEIAMGDYTGAALSLVQDKGQIFQFKIQGLQRQGHFDCQLDKGRK